MFLFKVASSTVIEKRFRANEGIRPKKITTSFLGLSLIDSPRITTTKCPTPPPSSSASSSSLETVSNWSRNSLSVHNCNKHQRSPGPSHPHYSTNRTLYSRRHKSTTKCKEFYIGGYTSSHSSSSSSLACNTSSASIPLASLKQERKKRSPRKSRRKPSTSNTIVDRKHKSSISSSGIEMDNPDEHICKKNFNHFKMNAKDLSVCFTLI